MYTVPDFVVMVADKVWSCFDLQAFLASSAWMDKRKQLSIQ